MGETITLKSPFDGFELSAYRVRPDDARRGGLVLIQEIFGVTEHIREFCDGFAEDGYEVIAPSFYDRLEPGFAAEDYGDAAVAKGVRYSQETPWDQVAGDGSADPLLRDLATLLWAQRQLDGGDPARLVADSTLARKELGWQPRRAELGRIVADAWAWEQRRPTTSAEPLAA